MDLIKQLGGYETLKREYEETLPLIQKGYKSKSMEVIRLSLLEYRRKHNTFEVGDKVVYHKKIGIDRVVEVNDEHLIDRFLWQIRHATDEEIAAGHRL